MIPRTSLGIDLSTSATGLVLLRSDGQGLPTLLLEQEVKGKGTGMSRVNDMVRAIMTLIHHHKPDTIVLEGYSLNTKNASSIIPLVEVGGALRLMMWLDGLAWYDPRASEVKKFATGKGNAPKEKVMMHVLKRFSHESQTNNTADAYVCAAMGLAIWNLLNPVTMEMRSLACGLTKRLS